MMWKIFGYGFGVLLACLLALAILGTTTEHDHAIPTGVAGKHVTVAGLALRVVESGGGDQAVILVHGMPGGAEDWEAVVPLLEPHWRVFAIDRPGYGYSAEPDGDNDVASNAHALRGLIDALGLKDVVVVGHSFGGSVALKLALDNPPALRGVVLVAPGGYPDFPPTALERLMTAPIIGHGITRALIPLIGEDRIREGLARAVAPNADAMPSDFVDRRVASWMRPAPLRARAEHLMVYNDELARMAPAYRNIARPVVILQGEADGLVALRTGSQRLARDIPGAELRTFPATGHYVQYRHPEAVAGAVAQVFARAQPSDATRR